MTSKCSGLNAVINYYSQEDIGDRKAAVAMQRNFRRHRHRFPGDALQGLAGDVMMGG